MSLPLSPNGSSAYPIGATAFWLTRITDGESIDVARLGPTLAVLLSGQLNLGTPNNSRILERGDVVFLDPGNQGTFGVQCHGDVWVLLVSTPSWIPQRGALPYIRKPRERRGRPLMNWMYDEGGRSRIEPFRWPRPLNPVPDVTEWPKSDGAFLTRTLFSKDHSFPAWSTSPRRLIAVVLSGSGLIEAGDGTRIQPRTGDFIFVEDTTGQGHVPRWRGERRMLSVTVADGHLELQRET